MWPKMLLELLPHFARLMPVADKYFANRAASDKAQQESIAALAANLRGAMRSVVEEQAGTRSQLQEQSVQIAQVAVEATKLRMGVESLEERIAKLEKAMMQIRGLVVALLMLGVVSTVIIIARR